MINTNAFGSTFGAMPQFDPSAIIGLKASTPEASQQPLSAESTYSGLPMRMKVQAGNIINPFTQTKITKPPTPSDMPTGGNTPGGTDVILPNGELLSEETTGDTIGGIPKRTLMIGGLVFAAGLVALSVLKG